MNKFLLTTALATLATGATAQSIQFSYADATFGVSQWDASGGGEATVYGLEGRVGFDLGRSFGAQLDAGIAKLDLSGPGSAHTTNFGTHAFYKSSTMPVLMGAYYTHGDVELGGAGVTSQAYGVEAAYHGEKIGGEIYFGATRDMTGGMGLDGLAYGVSGSYSFTPKFTAAVGYNNFDIETVPAFDSLFGSVEYRFDAAGVNNMAVRFKYETFDDPGFILGDHDRYTLSLTIPLGGGNGSKSGFTSNRGGIANYLH